MLEKLLNAFNAIFQFIVKLAHNFIEKIDQLPIKGGLEYLVVFLLLGVLLLALISGLSSFFRASGEFLRNVTRWLRLIVLISLFATLFLLFTYWLFFSQRPCFPPKADFDKQWTACKEKVPAQKKPEKTEKTK
ncbi:MAG: hypothetical protein RIT27_723 [Pseudomonadota bacterium]|jgi:glucan phosphoethanolaminetransferase (alkaline phosphatase superfamily)